MSEMNDFTDEQRAQVVSAWRKIQGSPDLLDGLLFGEFEDLLVGVIAMSIATGLNRQMPLSLLKRLPSLDTAEKTIEFGREMLSLPVVKDMLDEMSGL